MSSAQINDLDIGVWESLKEAANILNAFQLRPGIHTTLVGERVRLHIQSTPFDLDPLMSVHVAASSRIGQPMNWHQMPIELMANEQGEENRLLQLDRHGVGRLSTIPAAEFTLSTTPSWGSTSTPLPRRAIRSIGGGVHINRSLAGADSGIDQQGSSRRSHKPDRIRMRTYDEYVDVSVTQKELGGAPDDNQSRAKVILSAGASTTQQCRVRLLLHGQASPRGRIYYAETRLLTERNPRGDLSAKWDVRYPAERPVSLTLFCDCKD